MAGMPTPPLPPACAQCLNSFQAPGGSTPQAPSASAMTRSLDGKMRVNMGNISVITHPGAMKAIVLDHVKMVAHTLPIPQGAMPPVPGMPGMAMPKSPAQMPPMHVQELGTGFIQGIQAVGKRFTIQPPSTPKPPGMQGAPSMPGAPQAPIVAEVWTCAKTQLPVLTKVSGSFGTQTSVCKTAQTAEPHPSTFQIPPGYKQLS